MARLDHEARAIRAAGAMDALQALIGSQDDAIEPRAFAYLLDLVFSEAKAAMPFYRGAIACNDFLPVAIQPMREE